jgi:HK97 family phage major capsid protein
MEALEIKAALEGIKAQVETKTAEQSVEVKSLIEALEAKMESKSNETIEALKADLKAIQDHADLLDVKLQEKTAETKSEGYFDVMEKALTENFNDIKEVRSGKSVQVKAVGDMTLTANLTGAQPKEYNFNTVLVPGQLVNVADLVGSVNIGGGTYTFPREGAGEGSVAAQTEGSSKSQRDYDFTMVDVNTDFIAGFTRYSKKMANNLPFLTSFIPNALRRDYFFAENAAFNTVLAGAATASTEVIDDKNKIEMLINEVARLENANFAANGIVVRPSDFYDIMKTEKSTGAGYGLPGIVTYEGGVLRINGIPVFKATWLAANKYYVGDWSRVNKVITQGLSLEFSEQEGTNFVKNNITARIESQTALAVEQPAAIIYGDFTAAE